MEVNTKSNPPKKAAKTAEAPTTIKEYLIVSCLVGQLTFFISTLTSLRKVISFVKNFMPIFSAKQARRVRLSC